MKKHKIKVVYTKNGKEKDIDVNISLDDIL